MVGQPEVAVGHPAADADERDVGRAGGDVDADLVVRARGDERGDRVGDRLLACLGQAGGDADHRLLGDAGVDDAPGGAALDLVEDAPAEVGEHEADALVGQHGALEGAAKAFLTPRACPAPARP